MSASFIEYLPNLIANIENKSRSRINLIPSENMMSQECLSVLSTQLSQRYVFPGGENTTLYWPGTEDLGELLKLVENLTLNQFKATQCSVRPLSGLHGMTIMFSLLKRIGKDVVYLVPFEYGGHGNSRQVAERFGLEVKYLPFHTESLDIDYQELSNIFPQKMVGNVAVYIDQWVCLIVPNLSHLKNIFGKDCYIHHDTSHLMGLIAGGAIPSPLTQKADSFGGSMHKTFPGPQKAVLLWDDLRYSTAITEEVSVFVSHAHTGAIAALGVALEGFQAYGCLYAQQVIRNAKILANELLCNGIKLAGEHIGYTTTHQVVVDLPASTNLRVLGRNLVNSGISLNFLESGILQCHCPVRLGVQEISLLGFQENDVRLLGCQIARLFKGEILSPREIIELAQLNAKCRNNSFIS